jgi:AraC-like DNA-binding protein
MLAAGDRLELSYLHGGVAQFRAGDTLGPRVLPDFELVLIIEGDVRYDADGCEYQAPARSILFTRPGFHETYYWDPAGPTRHAYFHFGILALPQSWPEWSGWPIVKTRPDPVLPSLFRHVLNRIYLHQDWPAMAPGLSDCRVVETLLSLFVEPDGIQPTDFERDRPVQVNLAINLMREVIDTDPHRLLSLKELATAAGVSEKHLCRSFQKSLGHSPMRTYRLLCLQLALSLLTRSNLNVQQIADSLIRHISRGISPKCSAVPQVRFERVCGTVFCRQPALSRWTSHQGSSGNECWSWLGPAWTGDWSLRFPEILI